MGRPPNQTGFDAIVQNEKYPTLVRGHQASYFAEVMGNARSDMHVVVSWQTQSWVKRPFGEFNTLFTKTVKKNPPALGFLRELQHERVTVPSAHDAMVGITLERWLPQLVPVTP
jgi:hypothetical protein